MPTKKKKSSNKPKKPLSAKQLAARQKMKETMKSIASTLNK